MAGQPTNLETVLRIGPPTLKVKDLNKSLDFYRRILGLQVNVKRRDPVDSLEVVELGFGGSFSGKATLDPLLILKHDPNSKETAHNFAGLFHFAILVPNRKSLAQAYLTLERNELRFEGFADHLVSESLYLHDAERNGIEIYRDRPQSEWNHDAHGHVVMDTLPLDLEGVLSELKDEDRKVPGTFPSGAKIGHMHLRVTNLQESAKFYQEKFGLHVSADWSQMGAMFLAAGSYHHHIGLNVWHSLNGTKHREGDVGLDRFPISSLEYASSVPQSSSVEAPGESRGEMILTDPDRIRVVVRSSKG